METEFTDYWTLIEQRWPATVWALTVFIGGLWLGRWSRNEYIQHLKEQLKERK